MPRRCRWIQSAPRCSPGQFWIAPREKGSPPRAGCAPTAEEEALARLDAWLCDIKDMRIAEGLHMFGSAAATGGRCAGGARLDGAGSASDSTLAQSGKLPVFCRARRPFRVPRRRRRAGARGDPDVLPTGRNLLTVDPRRLPTRTALDHRRRAAASVDRPSSSGSGDWPRTDGIDLWGSATMRTGGEELGQIFAYLGAVPVYWDEAPDG